MGSVYPKVDELEHLIDTDPGEKTYPSVAENAAALLSDIADELRDSSQRNPYGGTTLITSLSRAVANPLKEGDTYKPQLALLEQAARVAANLAADCDPNRTRLAKAGYLSSAVKLLAVRPILPTDILRPLVGSLNNLTITQDADCVAALASREQFSWILSLAAEIYTPGKWVGDHQSDSAIAAWLWTIADNITAPKSLTQWSLSLEDVKCFLPPFAGFAPRKAPDVDVDFSACAIADLWILAQAAAVLDRFNNIDEINYWAVKGDRETMVAIFDFVEAAELPPWVDFAVDSDDEEDADAKPGETQEKGLGIAKAAAARTIVTLLAETDADGEPWIWDRVKSWLDKRDRPDLVACALLSFGNKARSDAAATALLTPELLGHITTLLAPGTPLLEQHALVGLLRNLSIPERNKKTLGDAGVVEKLVSMEMWDASHDIVGSVQGGAIGVMKNLTRDASNAARFLSTPGPAALHELITRTDDGAVAMEACRVWVNCTRSLARTSRVGEDGKAWEVLCVDNVIRDLCTLISRGEKFNVLINEGVMALALMVAIGGKGEVVQSFLMDDPNEGNEVEGGEAAKSAASVLASVVTPTPARPVSAEVQANTLQLLAILPKGPVRDLVLKQVNTAREEGQSVADGVEVLEK